MDASQVEIAEAAYMLAANWGAKDDEEYLYLMTWTSDAEYPPAMFSLAYSIWVDYERAKSDADLLKELLEYPRIFQREDIVTLIRAAAEKGEPDALLWLSAQYREGKSGFLKDPYHADELEIRALMHRIDLGRKGDHHELIDSARWIKSHDSSVESAEDLIMEVIEVGSKQPGGLDIDAAIRLANYYGTSNGNNDVLSAIANGYK